MENIKTTHRSRFMKARAGSFARLLLKCRGAIKAPICKLVDSMGISLILLKALHLKSISTWFGPVRHGSVLHQTQSSSLVSFNS